MIADDLRIRLKSVRDQLPEPRAIRLHRAISWLARADGEAADPDARFVFLWIAFNAAYAQEFGFEATERELLRQFFSRLLSADREGRLQQMLFESFAGPIRVLIENKYVFEPFWRALRQHDASDAWRQRFDADNKAAFKALLQKDTLKVLMVVFDRLYVLRNQLVHGGATWNSEKNRRQVTDGAALLASIVPLLLVLMLDHPDVELGHIAYPPV